MDTQKQAIKRAAAIRKIIGALEGGRHLSVYNDREFEVSEMHTCFCNIRQKNPGRQDYRLRYERRLAHQRKRYPLQRILV